MNSPQDRKVEEERSQQRSFIVFFMSFFAHERNVNSLLLLPWFGLRRCVGSVGMCVWTALIVKVRKCKGSKGSDTRKKSTTLKGKMFIFYNTLSQDRNFLHHSEFSSPIEQTSHIYHTHPPLPPPGYLDTHECVEVGELYKACGKYCA